MTTKCRAPPNQTVGVVNLNFKLQTGDCPCVDVTEYVEHTPLHQHKVALHCIAQTSKNNSHGASP